MKTHILKETGFLCGQHFSWHIPSSQNIEEVTCKRCRFIWNKKHNPAEAYKTRREFHSGICDAEREKIRLFEVAMEAKRVEQALTTLNGSK